MLLHLIVLGLSVWLVTMISIDTFNGVAFYTQPRFDKWQFWICVAFIADFFIELFVSEHKWKYIKSRFLFLIVAIPYQAICYHFDVHISRDFAYLIRYAPLIRGGYALAIVVGWFTSNKVTGLFFSYIITLLSTVYFASLTFFLFEKGVNPQVTAYHDAVWWAAMDVTTVGCNIEAVTTVGRILSVMLAALGMMMFPIFTVYVTNILTKRNQNPSPDDAPIVVAYNRFIKRSHSTSESEVHQHTTQPTDSQPSTPSAHS